MVTSKLKKLLLKWVRRDFIVNTYIIKFIEIRFFLKYYKIFLIRYLIKYFNIIVMFEIIELKNR